MSLRLDLDSRPVFGYEHAACNANLRRMKDVNKALSPAQKRQLVKMEYFLSNFFKILGAFVPLVGYGRIILAFLKIDEQFKKEIMRGFAEALSKGKFLILIDIAVTVCREYRYL